jgi:cytochrome c
MLRLRFVRFGLVPVAFLAVLSGPLGAADEKAAKALLSESKCTTCHAVTKKKDGPSYQEVAKKYKGKPDAKAKLIKHVTVPSKVEIDGEKEDHGTVKTRDKAKIENLVEWILSL